MIRELNSRPEESGDGAPARKRRRGGRNRKRGPRGDAPAGE